MISLTATPTATASVVVILSRPVAVVLVLVAAEYRVDLACCLLLTGALLAAGLVDELIVMVAPVLCEDPRGRPLVELQSRLPRDAARLELINTETLAGGVVVLRYSVVR